MNQEQRVIYETTDISKEVNDFRAGVADFAYTVGQYLYIGSLLPFNNLWFEMNSLNLVTTVPTVEIWYNSTWTPAVDVVDETNGLKASGRLQWNTHIDKSWMQELKTERIPALATFSIYNMYWMRISWSVTMTATTKIAYVGQKFANDQTLKSFYPDLLLANILDSYQTGKTDWNEQHFMAAEHIVRDLRKRNIIKTRSQLLEHSFFADAACHKVAEIVYTAFGSPYLEQRDGASKAYTDALNVSYYGVDQDADGRLDPCERQISTQFGTR